MSTKSKKAEIPESVEPQVPQRQIGVAIPLEKLAGVYSNVAVVHHSRNEFVLDFIFELNGQGNLVSRVITNPEHMKKLHFVLGKNIEKYEQTFGVIKVNA